MAEGYSLLPSLPARAPPTTRRDVRSSDCRSRMAGFFAFFRAPRFDWLFFFMLPPYVDVARGDRAPSVKDHVSRVKVEPLTFV